MYEFGRGLHALQDIYAHKDWAVGEKKASAHASYTSKGKGRNLFHFDSPDYNITRQAGGWYLATYKGSWKSDRYQLTMSETILTLTSFRSTVKYTK